MQNNLFHDIWLTHWGLPVSRLLVLVVLTLLLFQIVRSFTLGVSHQRAASPLFVLITIGSLAIGGMIVQAGVQLVKAGSIGVTTIRIFGQSFQTNNVGIAAIFIGTAMIVVIVTRLAKRMYDLAKLP